VEKGIRGKMRLGVKSTWAQRKPTLEDEVKEGKYHENEKKMKAKFERSRKDSMMADAWRRGHGPGKVI